MSIVDTVKHAPRWTWYTVAGVSLGAIGLKVWKGRAAGDTSQTAADGSTVGDTGSGSTQPATTGGSPPGVIVPPIITGGSDDGSTAAMALIGGAFTDFTGLLGQVVSGDQQNISTLITGQQGTTDKVLDLLAGGGVAPQPVSIQPPPVNVVIQAPPAASVPAPQSAPTKKPDPCTGEYPFQQTSGPNAGKCYRVDLKGGKRYNNYKGGPNWVPA